MAARIIPTVIIDAITDPIITPKFLDLCGRLVLLEPFCKGIALPELLCDRSVPFELEKYHKS